MSLTKNPNPKTKFFFSLQMRKLVKSFEGSNSYITQSCAEIFLCKNMCKLLDISLSPLGSQGVNTLASGHFWGFPRKKHLNARGFVQEFLQSGTHYRPG